MVERSTFLGESTKEILGITSVDQIESLNDWIQKGGETFSCDFVLRDGDTLRHLIAKACIKYSPVETVDEWMERRHKLEQIGVTVPILFKRDRAVVVEEFVPYSLQEAFTLGTSIQKGEIEQLFVSTYETMSRAGFWPISLHDVRSRGQDVVVIDMGEDIGGPHAVTLDKVEVTDLAVKAFQRIIHQQLPFV
jgi:hypothetical protein